MRLIPLVSFIIKDNLKDSSIAEAFSYGYQLSIKTANFVRNHMAFPRILNAGFSSILRSPFLISNTLMDSYILSSEITQFIRDKMTLSLLLNAALTSSVAVSAYCAPGAFCAVASSYAAIRALNESDPYIRPIKGVQPIIFDETKPMNELTALHFLRHQVTTQKIATDGVEITPEALAVAVIIAHRFQDKELPLGGIDLIKEVLRQAKMNENLPKEIQSTHVIDYALSLDIELPHDEQLGKLIRRLVMHLELDDFEQEHAERSWLPSFINRA